MAKTNTIDISPLSSEDEDTPRSSYFSNKYKQSLGRSLEKKGEYAISGSRSALFSLRTPASPPPSSSSSSSSPSSSSLSSSQSSSSQSSPSPPSNVSPTTVELRRITKLQDPARTKEKEAHRRREEDAKMRGECYEHSRKRRRSGRHTKQRVLPCDWLRTSNPNQFNGYAKELEQCQVPRCETCVAREVYSPKSVWGKTAPAGESPEQHRFHSRVRYRCLSCPWPIPPPTPDSPPAELENWKCYCRLREPDTNEPTPAWYVCYACANHCWQKHDSRFGGKWGKVVRSRRRKRMHKLGYVVRPRGVREEIRFICPCGRAAPKDHEIRGAWCTWCQLPCTP